MNRARRSSCMLAGLLAAVLGISPAAAPARAQTTPASASDLSRDAGAPAALASAAAGELARKVANPLASLVSVPIQYNRDDGFGPFDVARTTVNLQPVVPIALGPGSPARLISRTIVPFVQAEGGPHFEDVSGVGDVTQSLFVATAVPTRGGWTLGAGPVTQLPTGSDDRLSTGRWSLGPTAIAVRQAGPWTYGALVNHLWSVGGGGNGPAISTTFVQPFVNFITPTHTTLVLNAEASRDWTGRTWSVPVHAMVNQILKLGPQPMSLFVGARYWAESPEQGPEGLGWRFGTTLLFPTARPAGAGGAR